MAFLYGIIAFLLCFSEAQIRFPARLQVSLSTAEPLFLSQDFPRLEEDVGKRRNNNNPRLRLFGRQAEPKGCKYAGSEYKDGEEWEYYTTSKDTVPYYGFKLVCEGKVKVLGESS